MKGVDLSRPGVWTDLFPPALTLMEHLEMQFQDVQWTFGGGTVLMLRINHRQSKDIDLFVTDPQYLGYISPRLSDVGESVSHEYSESAEYLRFFLSKGEIDVVVGESLTQHPFDLVEFNGRMIRVETCAEIIAKKMWHRGNQAKARDLFDLVAVANLEPEAIQVAAPFMARYGAEFLDGLHSRIDVVKAQFNEIDVIGDRPDFPTWLDQGTCIINAALGQQASLTHDVPISMP